MCLLMWPGGGESWYSAGSQGAYVQYTHFLGKLMYPSFTVKIYGITCVCFERDSTVHPAHTKSSRHQHHWPFLPAYL